MPPAGMTPTARLPKKKRRLLIPFDIVRPCPTPSLVSVANGAGLSRPEVTLLKLESRRERHDASRQSAVENARRQTVLEPGIVELQSGAHAVVFRMVENVIGLNL